MGGSAIVGFVGFGAIEIDTRCARVAPDSRDGRLLPSAGCECRKRRTAEEGIRRWRGEKKRNTPHVVVLDLAPTKLPT